MFVVFLTAWILAEVRGIEASTRRCFGGLCIGVLLASIFVLNNHHGTTQSLHASAIRQLGIALERGEYERAASAVDAYLGEEDRVRGALRMTHVLRASASPR